MGDNILIPPQEFMSNVSGIPYQGIYEQSLQQKYEIGARWALNDGSDRIFRYCKCGATMNMRNRGAANANQQIEGTALSNLTAGVTTYLDLPPAHADDETVTHTAKDIYKGGFVWVMGSGGDPALHQFLRITHNDASNGTYVRAYLEQKPLSTIATPWITAYPNIYSNVQCTYNTMPDPLATVVCVPLIAVTANHYFWGQTWGPVWITAYSVTPGAAGAHRDVYWRYGTIFLAHEAEAVGTYSPQRAGYILPYTATTGDMCVYLQMAP